MIFYIDHFMQTWLLPPGCVIAVLVLAILITRFKPMLGKWLVIISLLSLWLTSTPIIAQHLIDKLQYQYPPLAPEKLKADNNAAIVVLEAGINMDTPEYGKPIVSEGTLTRIRYAAFLYQKTKIPVLVSGNDPTNPSINQADYMAESLKEFFNVPTKWKDDKGYNTAQEGIISSEILKKDGIKKIYLVTKAMHMPRSVNAFKNKGLEIIPAPTSYISIESNLGSISGLLPSADAMFVSATALREYIGILWYKIYYKF